MRREPDEMRERAINFRRRVEFARDAILHGDIESREFDTCFEMYDGQFVVAALLRLAEPQLLQAIERRLGRETLLLWHHRAKPLARWLAMDLPHMAAACSYDEVRKARAQARQWRAGVTELTPAGEQYVLPGAEKLVSRAAGTQLSLW